MGAGESFQSDLWRSTFELQSKNSRLGMIRLTDKQTEDSYICRKLSVLDRRQIQEIDRLVDIKLSIQSPYIVKLQKVSSHKHQQSCAYGKSYYLFFKQPYQTLKQQTLSRKFKNSLYSQHELQMMLQVGIKSLFFLKNINHPHENVSSSAFFIHENRSMVLGDPFMFSREDQPARVRNGFVYPSPEVIKLQNHEIEGYEKHLSDLFTFGLVLLQVFYMLNMDSVYQKYFQRVNYQVIHQKLSAISNIQLRKKLFILLDPQPRNRQLIFKHYIKSIPARDVFDKLPKEKFKRTIERYNLATSEVTEWKNDAVGVENRLLELSAVEGKKTGSVSTNQNTPLVNQDNWLRCQNQEYQPQQRPLSLRDVHTSNGLTIRQSGDDYPRVGVKVSMNSILQPNHPHSQQSPHSTQPNKQFQTPPPIIIYQKASSQPYHHHSSYVSYGQPSFHNQMNNFGQFNSVEKIHNNYQLNYAPSHSFGKYSQPLLTQSYLTDYQHTQHSPYQQPPSNLPYEHKQLASIPSTSTQITDISTKQLHTNYNQFPYYHSTTLTQSQQPFINDKTLQVRAKTPVNKVSPNSYSQSRNESFKQTSKDEQHQLQVPIPKAEQYQQQPANIDITQQQAQTLNMMSSNNSSINNISSTPAKQKTKHTDYAKYHYLSTINQRSQMADSFLSQLHQNKSQILIKQQQNDLVADKQRDYQSQRENIHNSFVQQIKVWTISYPSGTKYMGQVKNDKRNGLGTFFYIDGSKYHGHWLDNKMNGFGTLYYPNGKIAYQGEWKMDNFHGKGKVYNDQVQYFTQNYHYENCTDIDNYWLEYDGELMEDRKQGKGTLRLANGEYFVAEFKSDQLNGYCKFYSNNNTIIEGVWQNSKLIQVISERTKE